MDINFWHERWKQGQIGFHQQHTNPYLERYWPILTQGKKSTVFVPLAGKSKDLLWLLQQGHPVIAVEVNAPAVQAFFTENKLQPSVSTLGEFNVYECNGLKFYQGDFFRMTPAMLEDTGLVFDRASLVAMPASMRHDYVRHLASLQSAHCLSLLVTMDYNQAEMEGPPFSVPEIMVQELCGPLYNIEKLQQCDVLADNARFRERGLTSLQDLIFKLEKKGA